MLTISPFLVIDDNTTKEREHKLKDMKDKRTNAHGAWQWVRDWCNPITVFYKYFFVGGSDLRVYATCLVYGKEYDESGNSEVTVCQGKQVLLCKINIDQ